MGGLKVLSFGSRLIRRSCIAAMGLSVMLNMGPTALTSAVSMTLSLVIYAAAFGFQFALGFIALLFIHEAGHLVASRAVGISAKGPWFIPFVGAVIRLCDVPVNAKMEANIAVAGPAAGTLSALICLACYLWTDSTLMLVLCYTGCLLNLLNLIPCAPLDGEKVVGAVHPKLWWSGCFILALLFLFTYNLFILIIFFFSLIRLWQDNDSGSSYYKLGMYQKVTVACWYFGLLVVLGVTTYYVWNLLK